MSRHRGDVGCDFPLLLAVGKPVRLRAGDALWERGSDAKSCLALCQGLVAQIDTNREGDARVVALAPRGVIVGVDDLLGTGMHATSAEVVLPGHAIRLDAAQVRGLLRAGGPEALSFATALGVSFGRLAQVHRKLGLGTLEQRLASLILLFDEEAGLPDSRGQFVPQRVQRTKLAELLNCRVETVVRLLKSHPTLSEVTFVREGMVVPNLAAIGRVAEHGS